MGIIFKISSGNFPNLQPGLERPTFKNVLSYQNHLLHHVFPDKSLPSDHF